MAKEYSPGPQGSATYDHLSGKITHEEYLAHMDRERERFGLPPIYRSSRQAAEDAVDAARGVGEGLPGVLGKTAIEDAMQISREGLRAGTTHEIDLSKLKDVIPTVDELSGN